MKQEYVLLRKENDLLNSLIGQSFNQKSKFEAYKILQQIHKKADQYSMQKALCYIVDKGEIKGVGGSSLMQNKKTGEIVSDLILDQFGVWLAGIFKRALFQSKNVTMKDTSGIDRVVNIYGTGKNFNSLTFTNNEGILLEIGSGSTPPARTDFVIETLITQLTPSTDPVFNSGLGNFKQNASIIAGSSGTINESTLIGRWEDAPSTDDRNFLLFRDIISPGEAFVLGQTIALEYTIQL